MGRVLIVVVVVVEVGVAEAIQKVVAGARDIRDGMMGVDVMILAMTHAATHAATLPGIARQLCRRPAMIQTRSSTRMSAI